MTSRVSQTARTKIRLTREGWIYVIILVFISIGAVLRNVNLLILLSGMMVAPLILSWRLCIRTLLDLDLSRNLPPWVHARQKLDVEWKCTNNRKRSPSWSMSIQDFLRVSEEEKPKKSTSVKALIPQINPGQTEYAAYRCLFPQRGVYYIGPAIVSTTFPMGLVRGSFEAGQVTEVYVAPLIGTLTPTWDRRLQSDACGSLAMRRRRGMEEDEFYGLRQWRSGDSTRQIHWRATAKHGEPIIKQFDQKSDRDFALAIDLYAPSLGDNVGFADESEKEKIEQALCFSATVFSKLHKAVQGKVAVAVCGEESYLLSDQNNRELVSGIMQNLASAKAGADTKLGQGIQELFNQVSSGTPVFVVSTRPKPDDFAELLQSNNPATMHMIEKWTRWLQVGTPEFETLFQMPNKNQPTRPEVSGETDKNNSRAKLKSETSLEPTNASS